MTDAAAQGEVLPLRLGHGALVGRDRELAILAEMLAEARGGRAGIALCAGEPGIGKSRLLDEFPPPALANSVTVLRGGASEAAGMPPYLPFLDALGEYVIAAPDEQLRADLGSNAAILATILPTLADRLGGLPLRYPLSPDQERLRLYEAVAQLLARIGARGAVVLALDDLHLADAATCDLLVHVARRGRAQGAHLLIVGAYREGEADENAAFGRALTELNRHRLLTTLPLRPLGQGESDALLANLLRGPLAPEASAALHRHAEGNPFFAEELVQSLLETGALTRRAGQWSLAATGAPMLPPGVLGAIRARLARLDAPVLEALRVAAVAGRTWQGEIVAAAAGLDPERAEELLLDAARVRLVRPEPDGGYAFAHDKVREALYAEIGPARRRRLHRAVGEALESQPGGEAARLLADLAYHFAAGGDQERGVTYALAAGEQALRAQAPVAALGHYQAATRLLAGEDSAPRLLAALLGQGEAALLTGDNDGAIESLRRATATGQRAGDAVATTRAWRKLGEALWRQEALGEAREAFERALATPGSTDHPERAETLLRLADLCAVSLGRQSEGLAHGEAALALAERLGDRQLLTAAYRILGNVRARNNDLASGRALLERSLTLARTNDDPVQAAEACAYLTNLCAWSGDLPRTLEVNALQEELATRTGDPYQLRHIYANRGLMLAWRGSWAEADAALLRAEQTVAQLGSPEPRLTLELHRGVLRYYQCRFAEAVAGLRVSVELTRQIGPDALIWNLGPLALSLIEAGDHEEAHALIRELATFVEARDERATDRAHGMVMLVVGYARLGERQAAAACYGALLPFQGQSHVIVVHRALGIAAACGGDNEAARRHFGEAVAQARRAGQRPELALASLQLGTLAVTTAPEAALTTLAEGWRICDELGMRPLGEQMIALLESQQGAVAEPLPESNFPLSARQREVLRLLTQGRTNREIAETLFISEGTVANHVTAILTRLGVENRSAAVAYALRQGMVG